MARLSQRNFGRSESNGGGGMKGLFACVLPKLGKTVGGVVVGVFVFGVFKSVYERYFPVLESKLREFSAVSEMAMNSGISVTVLK